MFISPAESRRGGAMSEWLPETVLVQAFITVGVVLPAYLAFSGAGGAPIFFASPFRGFPGKSLGIWEQVFWAWLRVRPKLAI